jgi:hypothetical protein
MIDMGEYYMTKNCGLVRTVCRALNMETGDSMIVFVVVDTGGYASEAKAMTETNFMKMID